MAYINTSERPGRARPDPAEPFDMTDVPTDPLSPHRRHDSAAPTVPASDRTAPDGAPPPLAFPGYEVLRELGRGGMGTVYLVRNSALDRLEALKVVSWPWTALQFHQEVRAAARLGHPNVVTVYAAVPGPHLAFAMEYVEGRTLAQLVRAGGPLPAARACEYARQAALGLHHAHERGMVHRDVKPQNLIVTRDGGREVVKVVDFGLAKSGAAPRPDAGTGPDLGLGLTLGTPGYAPPEQERDPGAADPRADVYALGVTLRYLLTGRHPSTTGPDGGPLPARLPRDLADVLAKMTAPDPADRYASAAQVAEALERAARGPARRAVLAAVAVGAVAVGAAAGWFARREPDPEPEPPPAPPPQFVSLFNGTDLTGWVVDGGDPTEWRVEGGALATTGRRDGPQTWLLSARDFGDMRLRFQYQLEPGGNTGFAFRAVPGERPILVPGGKPHPIPFHQQVELSDDTAREWHWLPTGQVAGGLGKTAPVLAPDRAARLRAPDEWNDVEIEMAGQSLRVRVNGETVTDANLNLLLARGCLYPGLRRAGGRIGFQQCRKTARFRHIEVLDLSR